MTRRNTTYEKAMLLITLFFLGLWGLSFHMTDPANGFTPLQALIVVAPTITGTMQHLIFCFIYLDEIL